MPAGKGKTSDWVDVSVSVSSHHAHMNTHVRRRPMSEPWTEAGKMGEGGRCVSCCVLLALPLGSSRATRFPHTSVPVLEDDKREGKDPFFLVFLLVLHA